MRRSSLSLVLIALNVSLALVAVAGLAGAAAALLRRFTDDQALERVRVAALSAERGITERGEALAAMTLLLAAHATPVDLLSGPETASANLESFRSTGGLAAAALLRGVRAVATAGPELDWTEIAPSPRPAWSLSAPAAGGLQLASAALPARMVPTCSRWSRSWTRTLRGTWARRSVRR